MRRFIVTAAAALLAFAGVALPARAFPPTATVSPGYDRALAESRRGRAAEERVIVPGPAYEPRPLRRKQRHHRRY